MGGLEGGGPIGGPIGGLEGGGPIGSLFDVALDRGILPADDFIGLPTEAFSDSCHFAIFYRALFNFLFS